MERIDQNSFYIVRVPAPTAGTLPVCALGDALTQSASRVPVIASFPSMLEAWLQNTGKYYKCSFGGEMGGLLISVVTVRNGKISNIQDIWIANIF